MEILLIVVALIVAVWWFGFGRSIETLNKMAQSSLEVAADKSFIKQSEYYNSQSVDLVSQIRASKTREQLRIARTASLEDLEDLLAELEADKAKKKAKKKAKEAEAQTQAAV